jgi:hypothetical protein
MITAFGDRLPVSNDFSDFTPQHPEHAELNLSAVYPM